MIKGIITDGHYNQVGIFYLAQRSSTLQSSNIMSRISSTWAITVPTFPEPIIVMFI